MPRARKPAAADPDLAALGGDTPLPGMQSMADPPPRKRVAKTAPAGRGPGRPRTRPGPRDAGGKVLSHSAKVDKVRADLYGLASMGIMGWELRDPCAEVMWEVVDDRGTTRLEAILDRVVMMISRNVKVLDSMAQLGFVAELGGMAALLMPIGKTVWQHHGPNGDRHDAAVERDAAAYPAYAG